ncbi:MAG: RNA 2',3'-cyclic phosphodiesterase [Candidatus Riflebacteria bacterium]|nr:RNA 2',3'-cyclic phosphodiesterase [Candidatus Riflebacteria bacterium]
MTTPASLRLFFAVQVPAAVRADLARACRRLSSDWKPVAEPQMHLTLAFLGEVPADRLAEVTAAGDRAAAGGQPFPLTLGATDCFPNQHQPRVLFVKADAPPLIPLAAALQKDLAAWADPKPFKPHLTLARRQGGRAAHHALQFAHSWTVDTFDLVQSVLAASGATHTVVKTFRLGGA